MKHAERASMPPDYVDRIRELLAGGGLLDAAFDQLLPPAARSKSMLHWTPLSVARLAALRLAEHGARCVLDAGSGPGKFCVVGATVCPELAFVGIEQRIGLVSAAKELAERLGVVNAHFELGDALGRSWAPLTASISSIRSLKTRSGPMTCSTPPAARRSVDLERRQCG